MKHKFKVGDFFYFKTITLSLSEGILIGIITKVIFNSKEDIYFNYKFIKVITDDEFLKKIWMEDSSFMLNSDMYNMSVIGSNYEDIMDKLMVEML